MNTDGNTAALDRYLAERESRDECSQCGRPINGEPDMDGHYWTKHARYIDLCDNCGDDAAWIADNYGYPGAAGKRIRALKSDDTNGDHQ